MFRLFQQFIIRHLDAQERYLQLRYLISPSVTPEMVKRFLDENADFEFSTILDWARQGALEVENGAIVRLIHYSFTPLPAAHSIRIAVGALENLQDEPDGYKPDPQFLLGRQRYRECRFASGIPMLKCAPNPAGDCAECRDFEARE